MQNLWLKAVRAAIFLSALAFIPAVRAEEGIKTPQILWI